MLVQRVAQLVILASFWIHRTEPQVHTDGSEYNGVDNVRRNETLPDPEQIVLVLNDASSSKGNTRQSTTNTKAATTPTAAADTTPTTTTTTTVSTITTTVTSVLADPCRSVNCENGGTCLAGSCLCTSGHGGDRCETAVVRETAATAVSTSFPTTCTTTTTTASTASTTTSLPTATTKSATATKTADQQPHTATRQNSSRTHATDTGEKRNLGREQTKATLNADVLAMNDVTGNVTDDLCNTKPCQNGATCRLEGEIVTCRCLVGFTGSLCETVICSEESLPSPKNGLKRCQSHPQSMTDLSCELTCRKGHYFADGQQVHVYDCTDGLWLPSQKDVAACYRIDYCANVTCQNNGTCQELWRDFRCHCQPGFEGDRCQINIDECMSSPCMNGGTCVDGLNAFQCLCPANYAGFVCEQEIIDEPILRAVTPEFGPQAGGTLITLTGQHLIIPSLFIYMYLTDVSLPGEDREKITCKVLQCNSTHIIAETSAVDSDVHRYLPLAVEFAGGVIYPSRLYFQYKPNPEIFAIRPLSTIMAGGTSLTISGKWLDSVATPVVQVTLVATWHTQLAVGQVVTNKVKTVFAEPCFLPDSPNQTSLVCRMPKMEIPSEVIPVHRPRGGLRRKRLTRSRHGDHDPEPDVARQRSGCIRRRREQFYDVSQANGTELKYYLGFRFDGDRRFLNLNTVPHLSQYGMLTVHNGPEITPRKTPIRYRQLGDKPLTIQGRHLLDGVQITDYKVTVGQHSCLIVEINNEVIMCQPPEKKPPNRHDVEADHPIITVMVGTNIRIDYGSLEYPSNVWIIVGPVVGAILVLFAIVIALFCVRRRRRTKNKTRRHTAPYPYSPGEMIRLPSVEQDPDERKLPISDGSNGSLLLFDRDRAEGRGVGRQRASYCEASSAVTSTDDEFDPPEEFYENKDTIRKHKDHKMALEQFIGRPRPGFAAESRKSPQTVAQPATVTTPARSGSKTSADDDVFSSNPDGRSAKPSEAVAEQDMYINEGVSPRSSGIPPGVDQDIYENSGMNPASASAANASSRPPGPRTPVALPDLPRGVPQPSGGPPPVPNTPRPKLILTPRSATNPERADRKQRSRSHPFEEHPYYNSALTDSDDDDIYVNSPIKSRGLRTSGQRRRGRSPAAPRRANRGATLWY